MSVMVGYQPNGKPKRVFVYGKTQAEVKTKASDMRLKNSMGMLTNSDITVLEWARTWLDVYKQNVSEGTRVFYVSVVNTHILPKLGFYKLRDIKSAHLQSIVNELAHMPDTAKKLKMVSSQIFKKAIANDLITKNPAEALQLPIYFKKQTKRPLTREEMERICALKLDMRTQCFIYLLLYTGVRRGEAMALSKQDINFDDMTIRINKNVVFKNNVSTVKDSTKTTAGMRTIPILAPLLPVLREYVESLKGELLFTTTKGGVITLQSFRRLWDKFERAMGTKEITPHIFRHNFATILYNAGVDIKSAQVILGHSSFNVTMDIYTHLGYKNSLESASKLNQFLQ